MELGHFGGGIRSTLQQTLPSYTNPRLSPTLNQALEELDLSENYLTTVPEDLGALSALKATRGHVVKPGMPSVTSMQPRYKLGMS